MGGLSKILQLLKDLPAESQEELRGGPLPEIKKEFNLTDLGNAERLAFYYGDKMRYCHPWQRWLAWDGKRWAIDNTAAVSRMARDVIKGMYMEAANTNDDEKRRAMVTHARRSESSGKIKSMLELAAILEGIPILPDQLDTNLFLLNCLNGTVDLRTMELMPHQPDNLITKLLPVNFDLKAQAPTWDKFIKTIMAGKEDLMLFLQKAIGYALTGDTREQCMFIFHGAGSNGKSTFLETIAAMMGDDYAQQTPVSTLMIRKNDNSIPNDIARLRGARFVSAVEAEEGQRLAESLVKQMTGGDRLTARFMRSEFFEFKPEFKLFLATNHRPTIKGTDQAIWRRIRLIPFEVTIPAEKQDKNLSKTLMKELSGILNWALTGLVLWVAQGLKPPAEVKAATDKYRADMDLLTDFINENCILMPVAKVSARDLYNRYFKWCESNGERSISQRKLGERLAERGFAKFQGSGGFYYWEGIGLVDQVE